MTGWQKDQACQASRFHKGNPGHAISGYVLMSEDGGGTGFHINL